ncbi:hypothetical protein OAD91_01670, partial [Synechococcus sp. AH-551-E19]
LDEYRCWLLQEKERAPRDFLMKAPEIFGFKRVGMLGVSKPDHGHAISNFGGFRCEGNAPLHRWQVCAVGTNYGHRDRRRF